MGTRPGATAALSGVAPSLEACRPHLPWAAPRSPGRTRKARQCGCHTTQPSEQSVSALAPSWGWALASGAVSESRAGVSTWPCRAAAGLCLSYSHISTAAPGACARGGLLSAGTKAGRARRQPRSGQGGRRSQVQGHGALLVACAGTVSPVQQHSGLGKGGLMNAGF